ncbi:MAG: metalloregulator ArsR/SmtB family transcription factor [Ignavibacteria bacterium]|nr:metalloregulator ArsR/SmtB family transcription factor [Ignavibacteria bacterium]
MTINESIDLLKSLADVSRLRILNLLLEKPRYVEEIAESLNLAASTVSFHLKKMETAGWVEKSKVQYYIIYSLKAEVFDKPLSTLIQFENPDAMLQQERIERYHSKVCKAFFEQGRLQKLPVQRKKRLLVLNEFYKKFSLYKPYTEKEVNEIIGSIYNDYCTIRRELIEEGLMDRDGSTYWILEQKEQMNHD